MNDQPKRWLVFRNIEGRVSEYAIFDRYDEAATFWDKWQAQWSDVYFCRIAYGPNEVGITEGERPTVPIKKQIDDEREKRSDHLSVPLSIDSVSLWWKMPDGSKYIQTLERPTLNAIKDIPMFSQTDLASGRDLLRWRVAPTKEQK